jgi:hypothetical protein
MRHRLRICIQAVGAVGDAVFGAGVGGSETVLAGRAGLLMRALLEARVGTILRRRSRTLGTRRTAGRNERTTTAGRQQRNRRLEMHGATHVESRLEGRGSAGNRANR